MSGYVVVLDANVLYGVEVTDFFATMATGRLFRPHWSPQILDEVARNLNARPDLDPAAIHRRLEYLNAALPAALTNVPEPLIDAMPVNAKDRHVLALAVHVGAPTIVTNNIRDFPPEPLEPFGVEAVSADAFALSQVDLHPDRRSPCSFGARWHENSHAFGGAPRRHRLVGVMLTSWARVQRTMRAWLMIQSPKWSMMSASARV